MRQPWVRMGQVRQLAQSGETAPLRVRLSWRTCPAKRLVEHSERAGFVAMKRPSAPSMPRLAVRPDSP